MFARMLLSVVAIMQMHTGHNSDMQQAAVSALKLPALTVELRCCPIMQISAKGLTVAMSWEAASSALHSASNCSSASDTGGGGPAAFSSAASAASGSDGSDAAGAT
jgi:hypothetical protein